MSNPWDHIPSIWDGWEKQCFGKLREEHRYCAIGFYIYQTGETALRRYRAVAVHLFERVGQIELTWCGFQANPDGAIAYFNDHVEWTPEQFRELDRRLEYVYQQTQLGKQIDEIGISNSAPQAERQRSVTEDELIEV